MVSKLKNLLDKIGRWLAYCRAAIRHGMECTREDNGDEEEQRNPRVLSAESSVVSVSHGA